MREWLGLCPGPHCGPNSARSDSLAGFQRAASRQGRAGKEREGEGREREGEGSISPLLFYI